MIYNLSRSNLSLAELTRAEAAGVYPQPEDLKSYKRYLKLSLHRDSLTNDRGDVVEPLVNDVAVVGDDIYAVLYVLRKAKDSQYELLVGEMTKEKFGESSFSRSDPA